QFVEALEAADANLREQPFDSKKLPSIIKTEANAIVPAASVTSLRDFVSELMAAASGQRVIHHARDVRYLLIPGKDITYRCGIRLVPAMVLLRLRSFTKAWKGRIILQGPDFVNIDVPVSVSWWQRLFGKASGFRVRIHVLSPFTLVWQLVEVEVNIRPLNLK